MFLFPLLGRTVIPKGRAAVSLYCYAEPMAAPQPVSNPKKLLLFHIPQKTAVGLLLGKRSSSALQDASATELGQTGGTSLGLSDDWEVHHQSSKNDLIQSMFTRPLLALYLTAVIYPRLSGSAPALADTLLFCSQFTFERNFLDLFCL